MRNIMCYYSLMNVVVPTVHVDEGRGVGVVRVGWWGHDAVLRSDLKVRKRIRGNDK